MSSWFHPKSTLAGRRLRGAGVTSSRRARRVGSLRGIKGAEASAQAPAGRTNPLDPAPLQVGSGPEGSEHVLPSSQLRLRSAFAGRKGSFELVVIREQPDSFSG